MQRGSIWWASLDEPVGSEPGYNRPVVVVQTDTLNISRISTIIVITVTGNLRLATLEGNVLLSAKECGLSKDSVAIVTQLYTANKSDLVEYIGDVPPKSMREIEKGLRMVLDL